MNRALIAILLAGLFMVIGQFAAAGMITNRDGWSVIYPETWEAKAIENQQPGEIDHIVGPKGCYENGHRCGVVEFGVDHVSTAKTPKEYLRSTWKNDGEILDGRDVTIAGEYAYEITFRDKRANNGHNICREIAINHGGVFYIIFYSETGQKDEIKSAADWKLNPDFQKIISTYHFASLK